MDLDRVEIVKAIRSLQQQQAQETATTVARFAQIQGDIHAKFAELGEALSGHAAAQGVRMQALMANLEAHINWVDSDQGDLRAQFQELAVRVRRLEERHPPA